MLKLSKKADYGLMALQHIALHQFDDVSRARMVNTKEIAEEYLIPAKGSWQYSNVGEKRHH
ncbi:MAG: hypothetical protein U0361_16265 [Nitrospiraceae bacterium]